jgi:hypothetical protein
MTSVAKVEANRRNAQKSTGPRSAAGKARIRNNALQHGLAIPAHYYGEEIEDVAGEFAPDSVDPAEQDLARHAAEAHLALLRIRQTKVGLINGAAKRLERDADAQSSAQDERTSLAFAQQAKTLAAFDRYERRALGRRNRALRKLRRLERLAVKERFKPGPPRPKPKRSKGSPYEQDVLTLTLSDVMKFVDARFKKYSGRMQLGPPQAPVLNVSLRLSDDHDQGSFRLSFDLDGESVTQTITIEAKPSTVGAPKWCFRCPETFKMVRELHLLWGEGRFRSRHALGLTYQSNRKNAVERYGDRCEKLMERIGATYWDMWPPRPKHMHRRTYSRIWIQMRNAAERMFRAHLGADFPEIND